MIKEFPKITVNKEKGAYKIDTPAISEEVSEQLSNLGLTLEMVQGSILDVGAADAMFARAFENKQNTKITSIDTIVVNTYSQDYVEKADVRDLPYDDNSFDMVIAHASIPNVFVHMYSSDYPDIAIPSMRQSISSSFHEMLRVVKPKKKVYISPVRFADNYESQKVLKDLIISELESLKSEGVNAVLEFLKTYTNPENGEKSDLYRVILQKPETQ